MEPCRGVDFEALEARVLDMLASQGYRRLSLKQYRLMLAKIGKFMAERGIAFYSEAVGKEFLASLKASKRTIQNFRCVARRLGDCLEGRPYTCHRREPAREPPERHAGVLARYLESCRARGNKKATICFKRRTAVLFLDFLEDMGRGRLEELEAPLVAKALAKFTNIDCHAAIRGFLRFIAAEKITRADFSAIVPRTRRPDPIPSAYSPEEILKVEDAAMGPTEKCRRDLAIIRLASRMGLRSGDIAKLRRGDIDFGSGTLRVIQEKTGGELVLEMPDAVSAALEDHLENRTVKAGDEFVFHALSAPFHPITTSIIRHAIGECLIKAGVSTEGRRRGPHAFRSSLATSMINDGGDYETTRRILGHADPDVIKRYARLDVESLRKCAIEPPPPSGLFLDFLEGREAVPHV